jgi:anaerobic selenocysteine-containing dehydrogenase
MTEQLVDADFVARHTNGFETLKKAVEPYTTEAVERRAGIPADQLVAAARMFGAARRGCAIGGTGINMSPHPVLSEYLLLCLNSVCGRYMRAGDVVANPGLLGPPRAPREGVRGPRSVWGHGEQPRVRQLSTLYNQMPAAALSDEILTPGDGQLRALIVSGGNPLVALPDLTKTLDAFQRLDLLVSLDVRLTQTARLADYVIGCKMSLERTDVTLASDLRFPRPFAQYAPALVKAADELVEEWEFFWGLARAMGTSWDLRQRIGMPIPINVTDARSDIDTDRPTTESLWEVLCGNSRIPLTELRRHVHGFAPELPPVTILPADDSSDRLELAERSMISELRQVAAIPQDPAEDNSWPFRLISRRLSRFHNSWGQTLPQYRRRFGGNPLRMHPADMAAVGIAEGDLAKITSARGQITAVVSAERGLKRGVASMAHCWGPEETDDAVGLGANTGALVANDGPISQIVGMARQSAIPVSIERVGSVDPLDGADPELYS